MLIKRLFDLIGSALGLVILAPFFALIALAIKLDSPGPVFYRQERVGKNGGRFRIHKFRTMQLRRDEDGLQLTVDRDPRITAVGDVLRRYKIDELPQLIDVLFGNMSLVGPRPEVPRYVDYYSERDKRLVLSLRPGITDFASIRYRDENSLLSASCEPERTYLRSILPKKLRYYRFYVRRRTFLLDLKLIALTLCSVGGRKSRK